MAGLNFVGNAVYHPVKEGKNNIAQYEFMNYVLSSCGTMEEVRELLSNMNLDDETYSNAFPVAQLHWIIASETDCVVVESMKDGLHVHDNPIGVLTNNPPFETQRFLLNQYMSLSNRQPVNTFGKEAELSTYSRGMGTIGLPGDLSSSGRFAKVAFTKLNSVSGDSEAESVSQFFHILGSVEQQRGCCEVAEGKYERGILVCGTGIGMAITANKVPGIRAAVCHDPYSAERARKSNDAQILCMGERVIGKELAKCLVDIWLKAEFSGGGSIPKVKRIGEVEQYYFDKVKK